MCFPAFLEVMRMLSWTRMKTYLIFWWRSFVRDLILVYVSFTLKKIPSLCPNYYSSCEHHNFFLTCGVSRKISKIWLRIIFIKNRTQIKLKQFNLNFNILFICIQLLDLFLFVNLLNLCKRKLIYNNMDIIVCL